MMIRSFTNWKPGYLYRSERLVLSVLLLIIVSAGILVIDRNRITDLSKQANHFSGRFRYLIVFAMLGMGYMIVEVSLIQKFVFFLGKRFYLWQ